MSLNDLVEEEKIDTRTDYINNQRDINIIERGFILGLIAGEGSFSIKFAKSDQYRVGYIINPRFSLGMREEELIMLEQISDSVGLGRVKPKGRKNQIYWSISSVGECINLCSFIESPENSSEIFMESSKYSSYMAWKNVLEMINNQRHITREGAIEIARAREDINYGSRSDNTGDIIDRIKEYTDD